MRQTLFGGSSARDFNNVHHTYYYLRVNLHHRYPQDPLITFCRLLFALEIFFLLSSRYAISISTSTAPFL